MPQIPCKEIVKKITNRLKLHPTPNKTLAAVLVGKNFASISFLKQKEKAAKELNVDFQIYEFPENISRGELLQKVDEIVNQESVGGIIIQLPLPKQFNSQEILNIIPAEKDIDVLGKQALKVFNAGKSTILPPAVEVVKEILNSQSYILNSKKVAVMGTGNLIGRPIAAWLKEKTAELIILNSKTENIKEELKNADVIISGAGKPNLFSEKDLKESAIVIDFGYSITKKRNKYGVMSKKIKGDFDTSLFNAKNSSFFYTPTPGGTGPILVAKIMENFYRLNSSTLP